MDEDGLQEDIAKMISGEEIEVDTEGFENDFETFKNKDDVLTLLAHLGYLAYREEEQGYGTVRIPNKEICIEFHKILRKGRHFELLRLVRESDHLLERTIQRDSDAVAKAIARIHDSNYAPQFYNNEQAFIVYIPKKRSALPAMLIELK